MFERFTDRARNTVVLAQEEARRLNHAYIGTEHVLLGLLAEHDGIAARALRSLGIGLEAVRADVEKMIGRGAEVPAGHIPFTPRAKKVLELSLREALQLGHNYIGTEHILLGLVREGEGVAATVLVERGAALPRVREAVSAQLGWQGADRPMPLERPHRTPAADHAIAAAEQLAGRAPVGSHHLLEALARSDDSLAAKVLTSLGVEAEAVAAKIDELGPEGTTDVTLEEAAARRMEVRMVGDEAHVVLRDALALGLVRNLIDQTGDPVRGDDPTVGSFVGLWSSIMGSLEAVRQLVTPPPEPADHERGTRSSLVQRAVESRRRRGRRPPEE